MNTTAERSAFPHPSARTSTPAARAKKKARPGMKAPTRGNITPATDLGINPKAQQEAAIVAPNGTKPWPGNLNMVPNAMVRSALFGCARITGDARNMMRERVLLESDQYYVKYRGHDMDQNDCEVWELALAWCRQSGKPIGAQVHFSFNDWCRVLERPLSDGKGNDNIIESLKRLMTAFLMVNPGDGKERWVHLINDAGREANGRAYVAINPQVYEWLTQDLCEIDLKRKVSLRADISRWLHDYYSTSSTPFPMNLTTLLERSGSNPDTPMTNFRARVIKAVEELKQCNPPLFAPESRVEKRANGEYVLIVVKATNSRIVPPKRIEEAAPAPVVQAPSQSVVAVRADYTAASRVQQSTPERFQVNEYGEVDRRTAAEKQAARQRSRVAL